MADAEVNQYSYCREIHTPLEKLLLQQEQQRGSSGDFSSAFKHSFANCLQLHRYIVVTLAKMERFYNPIWLFKIGEVTFLMCLVAFVSTKSTTANSFMRMVSLGQYLLLVLYELFIICYFADLVYQNSQRCGEALCRSPWHLHMRQVRSEYLFFLLNSQRAFRLTAGKIYNLNIDRFRGVSARIIKIYHFPNMLIIYYSLPPLADYHNCLLVPHTTAENGCSRLIECDFSNLILFFLQYNYYF